MKPGDRVKTPKGPGTVMNLVNSQGQVVGFLVELDVDCGKLTEYQSSLWRTFTLEQLDAAPVHHPGDGPAPQPGPHVPDFIARAVEAQGKVDVDWVADRVETDQRLDRELSWAERIAAGEPTLEEALDDPELFKEYIAPYGEVSEVVHVGTGPEHLRYVEGQAKP